MEGPHRSCRGVDCSPLLLERKTQNSSLALSWSLPDMEENQLTVLDTDYTRYLFLCMENTAAPQRSLACQYLGASLTWLD